ncbi:uncharacterized protein LOC105184131 [Harpegnathos saltator]|uniref:Nucleolus and neural progenitor protein-like N-terminal domain-containing protein n=1 Tax=Harpegnathos saltator TaxID=610380 RepID=E2BLC4_HARSA|nr:uncharacterized protein LOC105184131 [Harpegnathos saltator]XP_011140996.1 uncharacterized protein LOC105184131 [Harpegnathos saltator]XP_011140997.1 uncharacterized protein LOC105184131 [Harpegnathos saltator]EFN83476.1 hypothetical protein EAI_15411 [Harpegnathos saltator]
MDAIWNNYKLQHPPYLTWRTNKNAFGIKKFTAVINKAIRELESMAVLDMEAAFLSRLIYRMKNKFRSDKGLKFMEKVNRALINYLNMALVENYKDLKSYIHVEDKVLTLPSRQLLEYVLVRTQGFAKLMERIEQVARYCAHFLKTRIGLGHAWSISLVAYSNISRIWFLSRQLIRQCCVWYKELYQYVSIFQYVGLPWIPENQSLPHDLEQWLSIEWMHDETAFTCPNNNWDDVILKLLREPSVDGTDETITISESSMTTCELIDISEGSQKDTAVHDISEDKPKSEADVDDIGEVISRKAFKASMSKVHKHDAETSPVKKRKHTHINIDVKTTEELKNKEKKKEVIPEDLIQIKLNGSKRRKKHKEKLFNNADVCKTNVTPNVKVTNKIRKQKRKQ